MLGEIGLTLTREKFMDRRMWKVSGKDKSPTYHDSLAHLVKAYSNVKKQDDQTK
jgi:hypothetical protein